jgi:hypothetical protein
MTVCFVWCLWRDSRAPFIGLPLCKSLLVLASSTYHPGESFSSSFFITWPTNQNFFMDIIIIMSWCIWMARNDQIFRGTLPDLPFSQAPAKLQCLHGKLLICNRVIFFLTFFVSWYTL